jgi:formate hydrogenlyase subunit 4
MHETEYKVLLLKDEWADVHGLNLQVRGSAFHKIYFYGNTDKTIEGESIFMSLSLETWIILIIAMIVVAKTAPRLSLKNIFRPAKKVAKHVESEWKDS